MKIDAYRFGNIRVGGRTYAKDVLILPPDIHCPWWRKEGHRLDMADLDAVLKYAPATLLVGTGAYGVMKVPDPTRRDLESRGIAVEILHTEQACQRFNALIEQGCRAAAALHLTC
jgi:hypothetical protein